MPAYSVVVATFLRPSKLRRCLAALATIPDGHGPERVVVADDGEPHEQKTAVYDEFEQSLPLEVVDLPYDAGLARKRNAGLERIETTYVLLLDDDQYVPTNVYELTDVLAANPDLGAIAPFWEEGGDLKCNAADYRFRRGWALKHASDREREATGTGASMYRYDHIANAAMFRTAVFDDYTWDDTYVIAGEDTDFYLTHRERGRWTFAVTPNYVLRHDPGPGEVDAYDDERRDAAKIDASLAYLCEKFDLKGVLQVSSHHHPRRALPGRIAHWVGVHLVPNAVLWALRRRQVGFDIEKRLLPTQE